MTNRWYKGLLLGVFLTLPGLPLAQPAAGQVIIVKSSDNDYFDQTIETLTHSLDQSTEFRVVMARDLVGGTETDNRGKLFITLGLAAAEALSRLEHTPRSINAYLTLEQFRRLRGRNLMGVLLDQPLYRYLAFCKLMLGIKSIGIIDEREIRLNQRETRLLTELRLKLNQYRVDSVNKLLPVLRRLLKQNDALLMLPRQSIYNRDSLKGVLLTSYRNRKPTISYSPAHVKSGALASIYSSPTDIGRHLALLVRQGSNKTGYRTPAFEYARYYSIATNRRVARALELDLPPEIELRSALDLLEP